MIRKNIVNWARSVFCVKREIVMARLRMTLAVVMGTAVLAMGCGRSGDSNSSPHSAEGDSSLPSKAEFVKQASAICLREREGGFARVAVYRKEHSSEGLSGDALLRKATKVALVQIVEAELAALRALDAPAGDEKRFEAILDAVQKAVDETKKRKMKTGTEVAELLGGADRQLRAYGLGQCEKE
jgi:hypothetical protein